MPRLAQVSDLGPRERATVADSFGELAPHPDVEPAVRRLFEGGIRAVTLSHGSPGVAEAGLETRRDRGPGRSGRCPARRSAPGNRPARCTCGRRGAATSSGAHGAGRRARLGRARRAARGLTGAWFPRSERVYPAVYEPPHVTGADLAGVVDALLGAARMSTEVDTPHGPARAHVTDGGTRGTWCSGHGAGGGIESADLVEVTTEAAAAGWRAGPRRAALAGRGRRIAPVPPARRGLARGPGRAPRRRHADRPVGVGGRSAGARSPAGPRPSRRQRAPRAAFPLHPPGKPEKSRAPSSPP